jgi:23S rRNA pseudouridine1911/1915/1917 synthase
MTIQTWNFKLDSQKQEQGLRLDQIVAINTGLSRRKARAIIKMGGVQINRKRIKIAGKIITSNLELSVTYDDTLGTPTECDVPILFEDDWLLIVNKPAGIASQGTRASDQHDLMAMLGRKYANQKFTLQHRLDQGTSGILIIAKNSLGYLNDQFQAHEIHKTYLARVTGPVEAHSVGLPIGRIQDKLPTSYGCSGNLLEPKTAITNFQPATTEDMAELVTGYWVKAEPQTGRTHQIRVHLAHIGRPILGDTFYNGEKSNQLWLHAWKLTFQHPVTGSSLSLTAPPTRFFAENNIPCKN